MSDYIIGLDEVAWGAIAGPVTIGCVAVPNDIEISDTIKDSKKFSSEKKRQEAAANIRWAYDCSILDIFPRDDINWGDELRMGMTNLATTMALRFDHAPKIVVDGNIKGLESWCLPKADQTVAAVACASIIAKVMHDNRIVREHNRLLSLGLDYKLNKNKGYATPEHLEALDRLGPVKGFHRMNIKQVQDAFNKRGWAA